MVLAQAVENASVGTSGAHYRGTDRNVFLKLSVFLFDTEKLFCDDGLRKFAYVAEYFLALDVCYADIAAMLLDDAVKFLNNVNGLVFRGKS